VRLGVNPEINALCTLFIAVIAAAVTAASLIGKSQRQERRGARSVIE
jgi:ABC-type spermidine/putrescine transport system permease subunit II